MQDVPMSDHDKKIDVISSAYLNIFHDVRTCDIGSTSQMGFVCRSRKFFFS